MAAALSGLVGGLAWISVLVFDRAGGSGTVVDALAWCGLLLVGVATLGAGASLVSRSATWLQLIVAVCFAALVASILALLLDHYDDDVVYAAFGAAAVVASVVALLRPSRPRAGGTHAR